MIIVQITDTHITPPGQRVCGRVDTAACLDRAVAAVGGLNTVLESAPSLVVLTGDLVDGGSDLEYERLKALLRPLTAPLFPVAGNHDERGGLFRAFPELAGRTDGRFFQYTVEDWPVRLVALDTVRPGSPGGALCDERLSWLDARLSEQPERPTIVIQHHPPFKTGLRGMDAMGLADAEAEAAVIRRHPQVERVLCGHLHRPIQTRWAGTLASTAPSTAHQIAFDLRDDAPAAFVMEPPGVQIHVWTEGGGIVSHTVPVGDYGGPQPFA